MCVDWYLWATERTPFSNGHLDAANQGPAAVCDGCAAFRGSVWFKPALMEVDCSLLGNMCTSAHLHKPAQPALVARAGVQKQSAVAALGCAS